MRRGGKGSPNIGQGSDNPGNAQKGPASTSQAEVGGV